MTTKSTKRPAVSRHLVFKNVDRAAEVAIYYGFHPLQTLDVTKDDIGKAKSILDSEKTLKDNDIKMPLEEMVALIRNYCPDGKAPNNPLMFFYEHEKNGRRGGRASISLDVIGTAKSTGESMLIKTAVEILKEEGFNNLMISINTIGDKDSQLRYSKELSNYYRKRIDDMSTTCRQSLKRDVFEPLCCGEEKCQSLNLEAPSSLGFLTEQSRTHFKEILEQMEILGIPYKIENSVLPERSFGTHTAFEIRQIESESENLYKVLARGCRYNLLSKKIGFQKEVPAASIAISFDRADKTGHRKEIKVREPAIYFVQFGYSAKMRSFFVIETLRQSKIFVYQTPFRDKLISQLSGGEISEFPFIIIMGQKEAMENSVIVRDNSTRSQETIAITDLPSYLRQLNVC